MEQNQQNQINDYELKRQQHLKEQKLLHGKQMIKTLLKRFLIMVLITIPIGGLVWYGATRPSIPEIDIVSKNGLHWHPGLTITFNGQKQEIPADIGIGAVHQTIHTHDNSGTLHLEIPGLVKKEDVSLGRFFKIWGKQFSQNCIFDLCNGPKGKVIMLVNGKENTEFGNYLMQDKDKIEIKYE